jgi:hypothetical protein
VYRVKTGAGDDRNCPDCAAHGLQREQYVKHTLLECLRYTDEQDVIAATVHEHMTDGRVMKWVNDADGATRYVLLMLGGEIPEIQIQIQIQNLPERDAVSPGYSPHDPPRRTSVASTSRQAAL